MKPLRLTLASMLFVAVATVHAADKKSSDKSSKNDSPKTEKKSDDNTGLPDPVATVDGTPIKRAELEKAFAEALTAMGKPVSDLSAAQKQQGYHAILDDMIIDNLLRKQSADEKVSDDEVNKSVADIKAQFPTEDKLNEELKKTGQTLDKVKDNIRTRLKQRQWIESQIADKTAVSDKDAQSFYDQNTDKFKMPDSVRASHILFAVEPTAKADELAKKKKLATDAEARIKKGEDFAKLAKELSDDPGSKTNGGDLDYFTKDRMVPEFAEAAFKMKVGDVSDPVKTQYGYHIIKVTDKKDAHTVSFDEAKPKIVAYLKESKRREAVSTLLASVRSKADVKVNLPALPEPSAPATAPLP